MQARRLTNAEFTHGQSIRTEMTIMMAIQYVKSRKAAERIYWAELKGLKRPNVVAAAARRMDDFDHPLTPKTTATLVDASKEIIQ